MAIKSILVHLTNDSQNATQLHAAFALAEHFSARLTAIQIHQDKEDVVVPLVANSVESVVAPLVAPATGNTNQPDQEYAKVNKALQNYAINYQVDYDLLFLTGSTANILSEKSRCHDLLVISSDFDADVGLTKISPASNNIATQSGCPVLIIPSQLDGSFDFRHPLIAWNGTTEAARAVSDAIPILAQADKVSLVNIQKQHTSFVNSEDYVNDLVEYLKLHEVEADYLRSSPNKNEKPESRVSRLIKEMKSDLLVLGAYGHSQLRELFFSSQTKELLKRINVPSFCLRISSDRLQSDEILKQKLGSIQASL